MPNALVSLLRQDLQNQADPKTKKSFQRFFKENVLGYGVKTAKVTALANQYFQDIKNLEKIEIYALCEQLWESNFIEEGFIACNWSYKVHTKYTTNDLKIFEKWIEKYITNWATCDTFCNHTIGEFINQYPQFLPKLKKWALSESRWMKRASAVSLILPARHGQFLSDIFEISETLLTDPDDMVQKGYGWLLKETSKTHCDEVFTFVMKHKKEMPRTALRYAIEKMPVNLKKQAMAK